MYQLFSYSLKFYFINFSKSFKLIFALLAVSSIISTPPFTKDTSIIIMTPGSPNLLSFESRPFLSYLLPIYQNFTL